MLSSMSYISYFKQIIQVHTVPFMLIQYISQIYNIQPLVLATCELRKLRKMSIMQTDSL